MKKILFLSLAALLLASCADKNVYVVSGHAADTALEGEKVYLQKLDSAFATRVNVDSTVIKGGKFEFKGNVTVTPVVRFVALAEARDNIQSPVLVVVEAGTIALTLDSVSSARGTQFNDEYQAYADQQEVTSKEAKDIESRLNTETDAIIQIELMRELKAKNAEYRDAVYTIAQKHIGNDFGVYMFAAYSYLLDGSQLKDLFSLLSDNYKKNPVFEKPQQRMEALEATKIGDQYTDLKAKTPEGKDIALSDYVGKNQYVLVDFWASWCPPCRRDMPNIAAVYAKYKDKGFTVVAVSLDHVKESWVSGIVNLNMTWPQMCELQRPSGLSAVYGVGTIPHTVLIDRDGKIVARGLSGKEIMAELDKLIK